MHAIQFECHPVSASRDETRSRTTGVELKKAKGTDGSLAECQVPANEANRRIRQSTGELS